MTQSNPMQPARLALAVSAAISVSGAPAFAADRAGRVLTSTGPVVAQSSEGTARSLARGENIYVGDVIKTNRGRLQIRFSDGALVSLDRNTRFEVEQYRNGDSADSDGGDGGASAVMRLFRGAMRTITGAIGNDPNEEYRMETPTATVGIRGTQYALQYCSGDSCGSDVEEGLYGHVIGDAITVENEAGRARFTGGRYFQVPDGGTPPQAIVAPPGDLFRGEGETEGDDADEVDDGGGGAGATSDDSAVASDTDTGDTIGDESLTGEFSSSDETGTESTDSSSLELLTNAGVVGNVNGRDQSDSPSEFPFGCISDDQCTAQVDSDGNLRLVSLGGFLRFDATSNVSLVESGSVDSLDTTWGRWDGDIVFDDGDTERTITGGFPWAYSENPTTTDQLSNAFSTSGNLTFTDVSGPSPVGTVHGDRWSVASLSVDMSFNDGAADVTTGDVLLDLDGPGSLETLKNLSDSTTIEPGNGDRAFVVALEGSSEDAGILEAGFVGDSADGLLVNFTAFDYSGSLQEIISGVRILEEQQ